MLTTTQKRREILMPYIPGNIQTKSIYIKTDCTENNEGAEA
jgi:hypothetical protein